MEKQPGFEYCAICNAEHHISDPVIFAIDEEKQICRECWNFVANETTWNATKEKRIIFQYIKVPITHALKWQVWQRDDFTCKHCGVRDNLSVDHIMPESFGGTLDLINLQTLCRSCNSRKSNKI